MDPVASLGTIFTVFAALFSGASRTTIGSTRFTPLHSAEQTTGQFYHSPTPNIQDPTPNTPLNTPTLTCYLQKTPALTLFDLHDPVQVCAHLHVLSCEFGLLTQPGFFDGFARVTSAALYLPSYVAPTHQEGCGSYRRCTQRHLYQALYETILRRAIHGRRCRRNIGCTRSPTWTVGPRSFQTTGRWQTLWRTPGKRVVFA